MKLLHLHIENFGKLHDVSMELEDGLNVLCRENGWGKSTLAVFIKAMLYGLPATTKRSLDENERKKYTPRQGGRYGGSIHFATERGLFRAERFFGAKETEDSFTLYDLRTKLPSSVYTEALGTELFGIDAAGFERSTYLSQRAIDEGKETHSITTKLTDLLDEVDDLGSYEHACGLLDKRLKFYQMKGDKGAISDLGRELQFLDRDLEERARKEARLRELEEEYALLRGGITAVEERLNALRVRRTKASAQWKQQGEMRERQVMADDLSAKEGRLQAIRSAYGGRLPTLEEAERARILADECDLLDRQLAALGERAAPTGALPSVEHLARAEADNETLKARVTLYAARREDHRVLTATVERGRSLPRAEELARVEEALRGLEAAPVPMPPRKRGKPLLWCGLLLFVAGIVAALAVHPAAIAASGMGAILLLVWTGIARKDSHARLDAQRRETEAARRAEATRAELRTFFSKYGIQTTDLQRAPEELRYAMRKHREDAQRLEEMTRELKELGGQIESRSRVLAAFFAQYGMEAPANTHEFGALIERLRASCAAAASEAQKQRTRTELSAKRDGLATRLHAFAKLYFSSEMRAPAKELAALSDRVREAEHLKEEITKRQAALAAFDRAHPPVKAVDGTAPDTPEALEAEERALLKEQGERLLEKANYDKEMRPLYEAVEGIRELEAVKREKAEQLALYEANARTLKKTQELLTRAKTELSTRYLGDVQEGFCHFLGLLDSRYADATVDTSFEVRLCENGELQRMESFSRGQRDLVRFCMRLSLGRALSKEGERPILLLDDPFVNLDDSRMTAARALLDKLAEEYQILYMVCHSDRA